MNVRTMTPWKVAAIAIIFVLFIIGMKVSFTPDHKNQSRLLPQVEAE